MKGIQDAVLSLLVLVIVTLAMIESKIVKDRSPQEIFFHGDIQPLHIAGGSAG